MLCIINVVEVTVIPACYKALSSLTVPYLFILKCRRTMYSPVLELYLDQDQISPVTFQVKVEVL